MVQWAKDENLDDAIITMLGKEGYEMDTLLYIGDGEIMQLRQQYHIQMAAMTKLKKAIDKLYPRDPN